MQRKDEYNFKISQHFACAIEYGDNSGIEEIEIKFLDEFLAPYWERNPTFIYGESIHFARCDITGLMSDCIDLTIITYL